MNIQRLNQLCKFLRTIPKSKFNYNCFISDIVDGIQRDGKLGDMDCGTNGCALGWCTVLWPESWVTVKDYPVLISELIANSLPSTRICAMKFFDLTEDQCRNMFWPQNQDETAFNASQAADKIEGLMVCYSS